MKYSIFHTSHCGSTLLACKLSKSITTLAEPDWVHDARSIEDLWEKITFVKKNHPENTLVKYSSLICDVAPHIEGKKIFLYRNFESHIKHLSKKYTDFIVEQQRDEAIYWAQRFTWAVISSNTIYIDADYFLNNQEEICQAICDQFEIEYKPVEVLFNVKKAGYNHHNTPIKVGY
jgi:hypothetical protein